jgi:hypothetical protein
VTALTNSAEGGTSGTTVTTGNSGGASGNAWDTVAIGTGDSLTFDSTQAAHGSLSYKISTGSTAAACDFQWSSSLTGSSVGQIWFRAYLYFTANPGTTFKLVQANVSGTQAAALQLLTTGQLRWLSSAGATILTTTNSIPLNQWCRIEGFIIGSATVGQVSVSLYDSMDSGTATETETSAATQNTDGAMTLIRYGDTNSVANIGPFWMDDLGVSTTGYLGPSGATSVSDSDAGSGADASSVTAALSGTETGAGAEGVPVISGTGLDAGTGADSGTVTASLSATDTGSGADAGTIGLAGTEAGSGADTGTLTASLSGADTAGGTDAGTVTASLTGSDTGSGDDEGTASVPVSALRASQLGGSAANASLYAGTASSTSTYAGSAT